MPRLWQRERLYSLRLVTYHFWIATIGIVLYITAMWISGIMQGLMWRAYDELGFLQYSFIETVEAMHPYYVIRAAGGILFLLGSLIMVYNLWKTVRGELRTEATFARPIPVAIRAARVREGRSMQLSHAPIEKNVILLIVGILITVSIGGLVQIVPLFTMEQTIEKVEGVRPYSPLELAGRNIYVREGCYLCHSQMIRPFRDEAERYGHYSLAAESMYDHPFQWGSKRTGPDLARVGGKYSNDWHVAHLIDPRSVVPESIMPPYAFLADKDLRFDDIAEHLKTLRMIGVPYTDEEIASRPRRTSTPRPTPRPPAATRCSSAIRKPSQGDFDGNPARITEMDALVAYLQMLGTLVDFKDYRPEADFR